MALTNELLKANEVLASLTDEQLTAIITLSTNDEASVIGKHTGEIYRKMDESISSITGIPRNGDEKTYLYLERATTGLKENAAKVTEFQTQVDTLTKEKVRLEKVISDGAGDAETKKQLNQAIADLTNVTTQYNTLKEQHDTVVKGHESELFNVRVQNDLTSAVSGFSFKQDLPESVTKVMLNQAVEKIKGMKPEYIDNGQGGKVLVFKDESGAVMRNPDDKLNPYTAESLIKKELTAFGILETKPGAGAGTNPGANGGQDGQGAMVVSSAKTQVEANKIIHDSLVSKGLTLGSDQYQTEMTAAWKDNNVASLPLQ